MDTRVHKMLELDGKITISRPEHSDGHRNIEITIVDTESGCEAISISMDLDAFAEALTGLGHVGCKLFFNDSGSIGKVREHKTELIPCKSYSLTNKEKSDVLKPFETDGWIGSTSDLGNSHYMVRLDDGSMAQKVNFFRFVNRVFKKGEDT